jgi:hypothetical protein
MESERNPVRQAIRHELRLERRRRRSPPLLRVAAATALLCALGNGASSAQAPYRQEVIAGFSSLDVGSRASPDLVDLDGDGDLDAVVGEDGGRGVFFRSLAADILADGFESGDTAAGDQPRRARLGPEADRGGAELSHLVDFRLR